MKVAATIEEQIDQLKSRGIIISDGGKAKEILSDIGYYRLGFYLFPFEESYPDLSKRTHKYKEGTKLEDAIALYYLDFDLRHILIRYLTRIEIALRTAIIYHISLKYKSSPTWFADKNIMGNDYVNDFGIKVYPSVLKKPVIVRHHKTHINDKFAPAWKTIEFMTLGEVNTLYLNLKYTADKLLISRHFGINNTNVFENYLEIIRVVRNLCAHGNALFDLKLRKSVRTGPAFKSDGTNGYDLQAAIAVISYLLGKISETRKEEMLSLISDALKAAEAKSPNVKKYFNI